MFGIYDPKRWLAVEPAAAPLAGPHMSPCFNELKREVLALIREESQRVAREG